MGVRGGWLCRLVMQTKPSERCSAKSPPVREAHGTTEPFGTTRKGCIRYTGVRVDGWFHFIRFLLYTKSVVPEYSLCMRNHGTRLTCSPVAYLFTFLCTTKILATHILSTHILYIY